jgi:hypothetical protein
MESGTGPNEAMLRILYGTAATALDKLRQDETISATLIADLEAVVKGSLAALERIAELQPVTSTDAADAASGEQRKRDSCKPAVPGP